MSQESFAVIFDMDGVIVDSNPFHKIALEQFCHQHGFKLTEEELKAKIYGRTNKEWIGNLFSHSLSPEQVKQYAYEKEALFRELYQHDIKPVNGLRSFLEELKRQGIPVAIATSAPRANVDFTLDKTGLAEFFPLILDESFVDKGKPDPEIYLKTIAALGFSASQCIVIEDSLSGIAAGLGSGARVVGISTTHTAQEMAHTHLVINDFTELNTQKLSLLF